MEIHVIFFFFQAEDGIRDHCVTGVQTCALPISERFVDSAGPEDLDHARRRAAQTEDELRGLTAQITRAALENLRARSEERRVGKECRSGGARRRYKKNTTIDKQAASVRNSA